MLKEIIVDKIISNLKKNGATEVKEIRVTDVILDERVRLKCQVPLCDSYNKNLTCPPNVPSVDEFRKTLA
ncbi:MAG: hypothetical protein JRE40_12335, partial [Deltaproteobacteria bacterium]|nr:hypothetical protein [Deltaproteobacteria bacterium]